MSYEAFCKGYVDPKELIGKEVEVPNEYDSTTDHTIVEVANKYMGLDFFGKHIIRTYITTIDSGQDRQLSYYWQRDWRGFDGSEFWNLDNKILEFLVPRLERFSYWSSGHGWPTQNKKGEVEYVDGGKITKEMVEGFKLLKDHYLHNHKLTISDKQKINRSFNLFKEYFGDLWT